MKLSSENLCKSVLYYTTEISNDTLPMYNPKLTFKVIEKNCEISKISINIEKNLINEHKMKEKKNLGNVTLLTSVIPCQKIRIPNT